MVCPFNLPTAEGRTALGDMCSNSAARSACRQEGEGAQEVFHDPAVALECVLAAGALPTVRCAFCPDHAAPHQLVQGWLPLTVAAERGHLRSAVLLLDHGADVNGRVLETGETALHWAATNGHEAMVKLLLERGADADVCDSAGRLALHRAELGGPSDEHTTTVVALRHGGTGGERLDAGGKAAKDATAGAANKSC